MNGELKTRNYIEIADGFFFKLIAIKIIPAENRIEKTILFQFLSYRHEYNEKKFNLCPPLHCR